MIGGQVKNALAKIAATASAGIATIVSTVRVAFGAALMQACLQSTRIAEAGSPKR